MTYTYTLQELTTTASAIIANTSSKTLLFYGQMGMGKTTLIKELCLQLGVQDVISSPTFSLVNEYQATDCKVYHFDFYRINDEEELYQIGFEDYLDQDAWIFIEWPEKIPHFIPEQATAITITSDTRTTRTLSMIKQ